MPLNACRKQAKGPWHAPWLEGPLPALGKPDFNRA